MDGCNKMQHTLTQTHTHTGWGTRLKRKISAELPDRLQGSLPDDHGDQQQQQQQEQQQHQRVIRLRSNLQFQL